MLTRPDPLEGTRRRLAAIERQLITDPEDEELRAQRFRLSCVIECAERRLVFAELAARGRMLAASWARRN